jgi:NAD(P)-dependent dehydrogenase (short-subunit alcohol dehydrogenase family)
MRCRVSARIIAAGCRFAADDVSAASKQTASPATPTDGAPEQPKRPVDSRVQAPKTAEAGKPVADGGAPRKPVTAVNARNATQAKTGTPFGTLFTSTEDPKEVREAHWKHTEMKPSSSNRLRGWGTVACEAAPVLSTAGFAVGGVCGLLMHGFPALTTAAPLLASFTAIQRFLNRGTPCPSTDMRDMSGKVCLVTGASSGIGLQVAAKLLDKGAIVIATHNTISSEATKQAILDLVMPDVREKLEGDKMARLIVWPLRLEDRGTITRLANTLRKEFPNGLDVLVNNAGNMMGEDYEKTNGIEKTLDVSFVGPYALTESLLTHIDKVRGRVIYLTSHAHRIVTTRDAPEKIISRTIGYRHTGDDDMRYHRQRQWSYAKFGNTCHVRSLHRRGVTAVAVNPGKTNTLLRRNVFPTLATRWYWPAIMWQLRTPEEGAQSVLHACFAPDTAIESGGYYFNCKLRPQGMSPFVEPATDAACDWAARESKVPLTRLNVRKPSSTTKSTPATGKKPQ